MNGILTDQDHSIPQTEQRKIPLNNWIASVTQPFHQLSEYRRIPENNQINSLKQYAQWQLQNDLSQIENIQGLTEFEANWYLGQFLSPDDLSLSFHQTMTKISQTGYLRGLDSIRIAEAIANGRLKGNKYKANVMFLPGNSLLSRIVQGTHTNGYHPLIDTAILEMHPPDEKTMWHSLVTNGNLPSVILELDKALAEDTEWSALQRTLNISPMVLRSLIQNALLLTTGPISSNAFGLSMLPIIKMWQQHFGNDPTLSFIHGEDASRFSAATFDPRSLEETKNEIIQLLHNSHKRLSEKKLHAAKFALDLIHSLRILGEDELEIGKIVRQCAFGEENHPYQKLVDAINIRTENLGIFPRTKSFDIVMSCLAAKFEIGLMLERTKARGIAIEELKKTTLKRLN